MMLCLESHPTFPSLHRSTFLNLNLPSNHMIISVFQKIFGQVIIAAPVGVDIQCAKLL